MRYLIILKAPVSSKRVFLACALCVLMLGTVVRAQSEEHPARERIRNVIIGKFAMEMDLTPDQSEKFFPRLRQFMDRIEGIQHEERETRMQLDKLSQSPDANPAQLNELLQRRRAADQQVGEMKQQFLSDISGFLTPQQVSRCSILLDDLPQKVRELIRERERARGQDRQSDHDPREGGQPRRHGY